MKEREKIRQITHAHIIKCVILKALIPNFKRKKIIRAMCSVLSLFRKKMEKEKKDTTDRPQRLRVGSSSGTQSISWLL